MDNNLSKPVTWPNGCNDTSVKALRYLAENPRPIYGNSPFNTEHLYMIASEIKRMADQPLYSQEYVSALLSDRDAFEGAALALRDELREVRAELEAKDQALNNITELWKDANATAFERIRELRAKLATPVRLPSKNDDEFLFDGVFQVAKFDRAVERAISAAGFKFVGDE